MFSQTNKDTASQNLISCTHASMLDDRDDTNLGSASSKGPYAKCNNNLINYVPS
jgi:hypothetical protein